MKVRIQQPRANRFCVFVGAGQIAAIEYDDDDTVRIERFGAQPMTSEELSKLARAFRSVGKNGGPAVVGASWDMVLSGSDWKVAKK